MNIEISYNKNSVNLILPDKNVAHVIRPDINETKSHSSVIRNVLNDENLNTFIDCIKGKFLCVLLPDGSRDLNIDNIIRLFTPAFQFCKHVRFIIATGTHSPDSRTNKDLLGNIKDTVSSCNLQGTDFYAHNCMNADFINAGTTDFETPVEYSSLIDDAHVFLVISDVKHHYFAGYSNPVKYFLPGICSYKTTEINHSLALDINSTFGMHPWHNNPSRRCNPLAQDQLCGMEMIMKGRKTFALTTVSYSGNVVFACFDQAHTAAAAAFDYTDIHNSHSLKPADKIIVSPGRYPNDIDLYIAQRALELTKSSVKDGGEILFIAACENGIGEKHTYDNFYYPLMMPVDKILNSIRADYKLFSHKPYKFAQLINRLDRIWMYTELDDETVRSLHLHPVNDIQNVIDRWIDDDPETTITIIDNANKTAVYPAQ